MRHVPKPVVFIGVALLMSAADALAQGAGNDITYDVNLTFPANPAIFSQAGSTTTLTGTIVTDGTLGVLNSANIVSYSLTDYELIPGSSETEDDVALWQSGVGGGTTQITGSDLVAFATSLTFNSSNTDGGVVKLRDNPNNSYAQFKLQAGEILWEDLTGDPVLNDTSASGTLVVGTVAGISAVPLPASAWLMLIGIAGLGVAVRKSHA